jgi:rhamnogalacturonan acetylesterase
MPIHKLRRLIFILTSVALFTSAAIRKQKPVLYIIGDSTVKNGSGKGEDGLWGWGDFLAVHFDTTKITIRNFAKGGRSSRTFQTEGLWDDILNDLKADDFVIMQFGHNDSSPVNDTLRARGTIRGVGDETEEIVNLITKRAEVVHSYGWYMRKFVRDTKAKGATPIVCSMVPRNMFNNSKIERAADTYAQWTKAVAEMENAYFIDLNNMVATRYELLGPETVKSNFFPKDHTHTNAAGAKLNAAFVADGIRQQKGLDLKRFLK